MATIKAIKTQTRSVQNIQKITQTMKMVSAAKYARAERELRAIRPFGIAAQQFIEKTKITPAATLPQKKIYIPITSDKGLCGACHSSISRQIRNWLIQDDTKTKIVCVGNKSRLILQRLYREIFLLTANDLGRIPPVFLDASKIVIELFKSKYDFTEGTIVYNKFKSVVSYSLTNMKFYNTKVIESSDQMPVFDSIDSDVIQNHLEFSIAALIFYAMKESACSEQSSRMTAMDNASKNAGDMISTLQAKFNRTRQSVITNELIEIISGAAALEKKD